MKIDTNSGGQENQFLTSKPANADTWKSLKKRQSTSVHSGSIPTAYQVTNLDFDVTENCNLGCSYCFKGEMFAQNMSLDTMKDAFKWLVKASGRADSVNCNFMGGEPTMRWKQIEAFVPWARRRGKAAGKKVTFSMTSNLTLWTDEIREFVDEYGFGVLMSIDGCPEVQDAQRPAKNGKPMSEIVEKWALSMLRTRPRSQARATLHPDYVGSVTKSMKYLKGLGFREVAISASEYGLWTPEHFQELAGQWDSVIDLVIEGLMNGEDFNVSSLKYYIGHLIHQRREDRADEIECNPQPCGAGKGYMMIDYTGDVWPCHRFDGADTDAGAEGQFRLANIYEDGFKHELQHAFMDFNHFEVHKESCNTCPVNEVCGGYCPAANLSDSNSIYTPHDAFCEWSQLLYSKAEKMYDLARDNGVLEPLLASTAGTTSTGDR